MVIALNWLCTSKHFVLSPVCLVAIYATVPWEGIFLVSLCLGDQTTKFKSFYCLVQHNKQYRKFDKFVSGFRPPTKKLESPCTAGG